MNFDGEIISMSFNSVNSFRPTSTTLTKPKSSYDMLIMNGLRPVVYFNSNGYKMVDEAGLYPSFNSDISANIIDPSLNKYVIGGTDRPLATLTGFNVPPSVSRTFWVYNFDRDADYFDTPDLPIWRITSQGNTKNEMRIAPNYNTSSSTKYDITCTVIDPSNTWTHYAFTIDSTTNPVTVKIYRDGSLNKTESYSPGYAGETNVNLEIGHSGSGYTLNPGNYMANIAQYNFALTAAQVKNIYSIEYYGIPAISSNPILWLDAADTSTITTSTGQNVASWRCKMTSRTFTPSTVPGQNQTAPTTGTIKLNSRNILDFGRNNTNGAMLVDAGFPVGVTSYTIFLVGYSPEKSTLNNNGYGRFLSSIANVYLFTGKGPNYSWSCLVGNGNWSTPLTNTNANESTIPSLLTVTCTNSPSALLNVYVNGSIRNQNANGTNAAFNGLSIGDLATAVASEKQPFRGYVAEILMYSYVLTSNELSTINSYLMNKWGIY